MKLRKYGIKPLCERGNATHGNVFRPTNLRFAPRSTTGEPAVSVEEQRRRSPFRLANQGIPGVHPRLENLSSREGQLPPHRDGTKKRSLALNIHPSRKETQHSR